MADGEILINTKIQTDEAKKEVKEIKKDLKTVADSTKESNKKIQESVKELTSELSGSYSEAFEKIEQLRNDDETDQKTKAATIAGVFKSLGQSNSDAMKKAWDIVKADSEAGSQKVIENLQDIAQEAKDTADAMSNVQGGTAGNLAGSSGNLIAGLMGGIAAGLTEKALDILKEAGRKFVEFSKKAINLASDLQEVQNVVDVVFPTMAEDVNEFAKNAIRSAGMSETLAKKYTGTFGSMAKSFGFTEKEAYDLATSLTKLTGDVASFYNLDHDEASTKLKAVFTGETEALKELGVVLTQTALDQYAMEKGYGKTTAAMTEQEKVSLRYAFVTERLTAASGDFIRTQDEWANQTRTLANNWDSYSASMGEGFIRLLKPGVVFLNDVVMPAAKEAAESFASFQYSSGGVDILAAAMQNLANETGIAAPTAQELTWMLESMGLVAEETSADVEGLTEKEKELSAAADEITASIKNLENEYNAAKDEARESLSAQVGLFDVLAEKSEMTAREVVENWKDQQQALARYSNNMRKAIDIGLDRELVKQLSDGSEQSILILDELVNNSQVSVWEINSAFQNLEQTRRTTENTMADIEIGFSQRMDDIVRKAENDFSDMADIAGDAISDIQNHINRLTGKTVYIDIVERKNTSGGYYGTTYNPFGRSGGYSTEPTSYVPYLAEGAVIPPNAPFTAVLGDQRNGYNLEGPEDMFRGIVREELENTTNDETPELLRELIAVVSNLSIDGQSIFDLVVDRNNLAVRSYGTSPLTR